MLLIWSWFSGGIWVESEIVSACRWNLNWIWPVFFDHLLCKYGYVISDSYMLYWYLEFTGSLAFDLWVFWSRLSLNWWWWIGYYTCSSSDFSLNRFASWISLIPSIIWVLDWYCCSQGFLSWSSNDFKNYVC